MQSPMLRLWELGENEHGGLIRAIISAAAGVLFYLFVYSGLAHGAAVSGIHSGGNGVYDDGHGRLRETV